MENEIWRVIPQTDDLFKASNLGRIRSVDRIIVRSNQKRPFKKPGAIMALINKENGYKYFTTCIGGKRKNFYVHRAVAMVFLENPNQYPEVNHIDGDKANNILSNLEWCSRSQNVVHAISTGLVRAGRDKINAIKIINKSDKTIFGSIREAAGFYGIKYGLLKEALKRDCERKNLIYGQLMYLSDYNAEQAKEMGLSVNSL